MSKDEFKKIDLVNKFINHIESKNYSDKTLLSYINDLYYFYMFIKKDLDKVNDEDIRD